MSDIRKRSWLSFSIRDLFLATTIVGLVFGWSLDRWRLKSSLAEEQDFHQSLFAIERNEMKNPYLYQRCRIWCEPPLRLNDY
jgi:hypothetical protein